MTSAYRIAAALGWGAFALGSPASAQDQIARTTMARPAQAGLVDLPTTGCDPASEIWFPDAGLASVRNTTCPTIQPFLPRGKATGAAVIIAPGGGFLGLAIDKEGWRVARWLARHGVAAFVLKYRVLPTPRDQNAFVDELQKAIHGQQGSIRPPEDTPAEARADGLAALRWVRHNAAKYGVDPTRVGFMGFSAGGFLTRTMVAEGGADKPAFAAPIYPNMAPLNVPADAPPMFVAIAADDFLLARVQGFPLVDSYRAAGKPIEFHLFTRGGHGFGLGLPDTPSADWPDDFMRWLKAVGMLAPRRN